MNGWYRLLPWWLGILATFTLATLALIRLGSAWATFAASMLALVMATSAFLLAWLAHRSANRRPKLRLEIETWMASDSGPYLSIETDASGVSHVSKMRPLTEWDLVLHNDGEAPARFPVIFLQFENLSFHRDALGKGWRDVEHVQPFGWVSFEWIGGVDVIVYPGLPYRLERLYLGGGWCWYGPIDTHPPQVSWTLAADGFGPCRTTTRIGTREIDLEAGPPSR